MAYEIGFEVLKLTSLEMEVEIIVTYRVDAENKLSTVREQQVFPTALAPSFQFPHVRHSEYSVKSHCL